MKPSLLLTISLSLLLDSVSAHYAFSKFLVNNTETAQWQYVRNLSLSRDPHNPAVEPLNYNPMFNLESVDMRCGRDAWKPERGATTKVATVIAGEKVGFRIEYPAVGIFHDGPGTAYLSKAPGNVKEYPGDGNWFKIHEAGPISKTCWPFSCDVPAEYNFTIPRKTPPGQYLLRVEQFWPRVMFNESQFYVSCAQIDVVGPGGGKPGPFAKFPGVYDNYDPGVWVDDSINMKRDLSSYKVPGPAPWKG
ncbi:lytic polysaccharide monooxygenase [Patellaria atrata CBS 101060]|uniref:lytic cellulose monooxygenase (C4-dehydrogenating) n=1 Tax=Patellaria atrata CBS 101060 TaxID=1346257 RepID=A0A9P4VPA6_9PEZI|nr:lytic polysaccharide monooxygenase [Patellaria atrata CBS 101060]